MKLPVPVNDNDRAIGPSDALVTVVSYGDYQCPDCHNSHRAIEKIFDELLNQVRFVYRHFPLIRVHAHALRAAEAAESAAAQNKFWEMHRRLFLHPDKLEERNLRHHAREIGLNLERFDREMAAGIYRDQILKDCQSSMIQGISGTPTTFINGELYALSGAELLNAVKALAGK